MFYFLAFILVSAVFKLLKHRFSTQIVEVESDGKLEPYWDFKNHRPVGMELQLLKEEPPKQSEMDGQTHLFYENLVSEIGSELLAADPSVEQTERSVAYPDEHLFIEDDSCYDNLYSEIPEEEPYWDEAGSEEIQIDNHIESLEEDVEILGRTGLVIGREGSFVHFYANETKSRCWINTDGEVLPHDREIRVVIKKTEVSTTLLQWEEL